MVRCLASVALIALGCSGSPKLKTSTDDTADDPDGPHRVAVEAQLAPYLSHEVFSGVVIGLYDAGKREIYGFGAGPGGKEPTGQTLFEIGSVTKVYTSILLADAVQRREVTLDQPVAELLPTGVTVPTQDKVPITLKHLALHSSGLPRLPPSLEANPAADPYAAFGEDELYRDLNRTRLGTAPGTEISYSNYGVGLLGFALGRKVGGGYRAALESRVLVPLGLRETFVALPEPMKIRLAAGRDADLQPAPRWTYKDPLAGAGVLISSARDQLRLLEAELDAASGGSGPLRRALRLTQEPQLNNIGANQGLGWQIDSAGRHWHNGGTAGYRSFVAFDLKSRRAVVVLAATSSTLVDLIGGTMFDVLEGTQKPPPVFATPEKLASYAGTYELAGAKLAIVVEGRRLWAEAPNEPRRRMMPMPDDRFWIEAIQGVCRFESEAGKITRLVFSVGGREIVATRVP